MKIKFKVNNQEIESHPNAIYIEMDGQQFQITQYVNQMKIVKTEGVESENIHIQPCVANSILIK